MAEDRLTRREWNPYPWALVAGLIIPKAIVSMSPESKRTDWAISKVADHFHATIAEDRRALLQDEQVNKLGAEAAKSLDQFRHAWARYKDAREKADTGKD